MKLPLHLCFWNNHKSGYLTQEKSPFTNKFLMNCIAVIVIVSLLGGLWSSTPVCLRSYKSHSVCYGNLELGKKKKEGIKVLSVSLHWGLNSQVAQIREQGERTNLQELILTCFCVCTFIYICIFCNYFCFSHYFSLNGESICTGFCSLKAYQY